MKKYIRRLLVIIIEVTGCILALYLGPYCLFIRPVFLLYHGFVNNSLTLTMIITSAIRILFCTTAMGGVWCIFDIIAGKFRDE